MMTVSRIRDSYLKGKNNPRALIISLLAKIRDAQTNAGDTAWIHVATDKQIEEQLLKLESLSCNELPLYGIPFAVKDNIDVRDWETTAACPAYAYIAVCTATSVQKLMDAGAILIGKTNLDQFATGLVGTRSPYGAVPNTFDPAYVSGGSSSGSASVVARGLVPFSLGTDTAGSGRVPAGFNNVVGMKPTPGLVSTFGVLPACKTLDCVSVFTLTAADAELVLSVMKSTLLENQCEPQFHPAITSVNRFPGNLRIGIPDNCEFFGNKAYQASFIAALSQISKMSAQQHRFEFEPFSQVANLLYLGPWVAERYTTVADLLARQPKAVDATVRKIVEMGTRYTAADAYLALYKLKELEVECNRVWQTCDVLMVPTAPTHPGIEAVRQEPVTRNSELGVYTNFVNLLGYAAISVPAGFTKQGMPFGVTFIAPGGHDEALLLLAAQWQAANDNFLGAHLGKLPKAEYQIREKPSASITLAVVGAHLQGMPLHQQLVERKCRFLHKATTAKRYRLYALADTTPPKPGLARVNQSGMEIELEVYEMPLHEVGSFLGMIPPPLGLGNVELADGSWVKGFICEPSIASPCNSFQMYCGLEASGLYVHGSGHDNFHEITQPPLPPGGILNFDLSAKIQDSYQIAFRWGFPFYCAMPYLRLGYNNAKWKIDAENSELLNAVANLRSNQLSKRLHGVLVGVGLDMLLCPEVVFGFQFDWTTFNKQTISLASKTVPNFNPDAKVKFNPVYSRLTLRLSYLF